MNPSDLDLLIPATADTPGLTHHWATVTATDPLRVRLDGDTAALPVTPVDLVGNLRSGDRVRVALDAGQVFLTGRLGGAAGTSIALTPLVVAGSPQYTPMAYRAADGFVHLDGGITRAADAGLGTSEIPSATFTAIATLPVGYRPAKYQYYPTALPNNAYASGLRVQVSGAIEVIFGTGAPTAVVLPFTGIRFRAAGGA